MKFEETDNPLTINLVPLLDTIFILLVFFTVIIMAASFNKSIPVSVPDAVSGIDIPKFDTVALDKNGRYYYNDRDMALSKLLEILMSQKDRQYVIKADTTIPFGTVVKLLDDIRKTGVENVFFEVSSK